MLIQRITAIYSISTGIAILGFWLHQLYKWEVPEIAIQPFQLGYHLIAESVTGLLLVIGGVAVMTKRKWGLRLNLISLGMLLYTTILTAGYYVERGYLPEWCVFLSLAAVTVVIIGLNFREQ